MPKISIVMPVYDAEKHLRACLDSVLAQTLRDFEVICVDDGSTDDSPAILDAYAKRDARIRVIPCAHTNAGRCRNVGIAEAHGDYLLFLDADDLFAPELFETLYNAAKAAKADIALCEHVDFNDGDDTTRLFAQAKTVAPKVYREPAKNIDIYRWQGWPWDKLIAHRLIDRYALSFQEQRTTNDVCFILSALSVAGTVVECPIPLVAYRRNISGSLTATRGKSPRCFYDALVGYFDRMRALGVFPDNGNLLENFRVYSCDQAFYQLDSVPGSDAAKTIFPLLKELCSRWNWCEALERDGKHPLLGQRCKSLMRADDVVEAYKSDLVFLRKCFDELTAVRQSHTYRFAQFLVKLIRTSRSFINAYRCGNEIH